MSLTSLHQSVKLSRKRICDFQTVIWDYYRHYGRHDLPWRLSGNPYEVYISEVMLQQTQVSRVLTKYPAFLNRFPTIQDLASASFGDVLEEWKGMGYNRRALFLHRAADEIVRNYGGLIPRDPQQLALLPGIGKHTAGSIAAFAYNTPTVFIETNIRRTFIHHFFQGVRTISDNELYPIIHATLPENDARNWYNALMDYGTYLAKTVANPNHKSRHYKKQSPFETSLRKVRGKILQVMSEHEGNMSQDDLRALPFELERINNALSALVKEGFLIQKGNYYHIA